MERSKFANCFLKTKGETLFEASKKDDGAFIVNLNGYFVIPIETPIEEIKDMQKKYKEEKESINACPCCGNFIDE